MIFENIKTIQTAEEILDKAFRRSKKTFSGKKIFNLRSKIESYESMVSIASNIISDNLINIVKMFPSFKNIDLFYKEIADLLVDLNHLKQSLYRVDWASKKIHELSRSYISKMKRSKQPDVIQKQVYGRISSIVDSIASDLVYLNNSRNKLIDLPDINPEVYTIIVSGYPNVGKSSFVSQITNANLEIAAYPFTTTNINIGHLLYNKNLYQVIDTPGLLDRPMNTRNPIELQSIIALRHLKAIILILIDPSESCGYSIKEQLNLVFDIKKYFNTSPILIISNKLDLINIEEINKRISCIDHFISTKNMTGINDLLNKIQEYTKLL